MPATVDAKRSSGEPRTLAARVDDHVDLVQRYGKVVVAEIGRRDRDRVPPGPIVHGLARPYEDAHVVAPAKRRVHDRATEEPARARDEHPHAGACSRIAKVSSLTART